MLMASVALPVMANVIKHTPEQIREHERFLKNQREYQAWHKKFDNAMVPEDAREDMVDTTSSPPNPELANTSYNQALPSNDADDSPLTRNNPPPSNSSVNEKFGYDGNGHRVLVIKNGKKTIEAHDRDGKLMAKIDESTGIETDYIWLGDEKVVAIKSKEGQQQSVTYFHNNLLGSPLVGTDEKGNKKWDENYKPYGSELIKNAGRDNPHVGYTGKEFDADTGLSYYGARFYDPGIGRFIGPDPAVFNPANPMTFNLYAYANDNPYTYKDKDGKAAEPWQAMVIQGSIGGLIGGIIGFSEASRQPHSTPKSRFDGAVVGAAKGAASAALAGASAEATNAALGLGGFTGFAVKNGVAFTTSVTTLSLANKFTTGSYDVKSAVLEAFAQRGADIPMSPSSMDELPIAGKLLAASNIGIGEYAYGNIAAKASEKSQHTSSVGNKSASHSGEDHGDSDHDSGDDDHDSH